MNRVRRALERGRKEGAPSYLAAMAAAYDQYQAEFGPAPGTQAPRAGPGRRALEPVDAGERRRHRSTTTTRRPSAPCRSAASPGKGVPRRSDAHYP